MVRWVVGGFLLLGAAIFLGCSREETSKEQLYPITGKIVGIDPGKQWVILDHEDIPGLMKAMRMKFAVGEPEVLEGLTVGDELVCSLKVTEDGQYVLVQSSC